MRRRAYCALAALLACFATSARADDYVDPKLLDVPWGNYSFTRQAWRGYAETVPARAYLDGLGVVWGQVPPGMSEDAFAAELATAGFARVRLEIPWGSVDWDERGFVPADADKLARTLRALRRHGLRPLVLLNANHLQPCPVQWRELVVLEDAAAGSDSLLVTGDLRGAAAHPATLMSLADGVTPGPLLVSSAGNGRQRIALAKGVPRDVRAGERLRVALLRYAPLNPVGTAEFESTVAGWLRYVALTAELVTTHYGDDFDVEIWNELTFGSGFLDARRYGATYDREPPDLLQPGGAAWELAARTVQALRRSLPRVRVIWGFSNTTFFHTKIPDLPPLDGQSYHPYGTGRRCFADMVRGRERLLLDAGAPAGCAVQPEGYAHSWQQTESLVRLIAPAVRNVRPPGVGGFSHYITEHGLRPRELGIATAVEAHRAKEKFLLRAPLLWLGKGITAVYVYAAYDADDAGFGFLGRRGETTPGLHALRRMTQRLDGAVPLDAVRPLTFAVERDSAGPPAAPIAGTPQQEHVALVPLQIGPRRFAVAAYVMTQDFPRDLPPQPYFIDVTGVGGASAAVTFYSPESATLEPIEVVARAAEALRVRVGLTDVPRLIEIEEEPR